MRQIVWTFLVAGWVLDAAQARAMTWPDVPLRIEKNLSSPDAAARRAAAVELTQLDVARATPLVNVALNDVDIEVKLAAADAAIRLDMQTASEVVLPWLDDRETRLRLKACEVIRAMPTPNAVPRVARALGDVDPQVRSSAADALSVTGSPEAVPALLGKLDDPIPAVRIAVVRALSRLGDPRAVIPLVGKVQDSVSDVRREVARALGDLGDPRASQALLLELRDNMPEVRIDALSALGRLHAKDAVDVIAPLATDRTAALRQAAIAALGRIGTPEAVRILMSTLGTGDDAGGGLESTPVREALVAAGTHAIPAMHDLLASTVSGAVATSAAWVLGELHAANEASSLIAAMRRGSLSVAACLHALATASSDTSLPVVLEFINDSNPANRAEATRAVRMLLDPNKPDGRAVEPIAAALRDVRLSSAQRAELATVLGRTGAPRAATILESLTKAHDEVVKLAAIDALGALGPGAVASSHALLELVSSTDPTIRLRASIALGECGGASARDALLAKLDTSEELDRSALLTSIAGILSREPSDAGVAKLSRTLELAVGPERDAIIVAIGGSSSLPSALQSLARIAKSEDARDRRAVATVLSPSGPATNNQAAQQIALALLTDVDSSVRAEAAWSLGSIGDATATTKLSAATRDAVPDVAMNAAAAIGRIAARIKQPNVARDLLCTLIGETSGSREIAARTAETRANALVSLALAQTRCSPSPSTSKDEGTSAHGAIERRALEDPSAVVRLGAAVALRVSSTLDDTHALERCASTDRIAAVARRCRSPLVIPEGKPHALLVYVAGDGHVAPDPHSPYLLLFSDGLMRAGTTDRRGAVFDPRAAPGEVTLRRRNDSH